MLGLWQLQKQAQQLPHDSQKLLSRAKSPVISLTRMLKLRRDKTPEFSISIKQKYWYGEIQTSCSSYCLQDMSVSLVEHGFPGPFRWAKPKKSSQNNPYGLLKRPFKKALLTLRSPLKRPFKETLIPQHEVWDLKLRADPERLETSRGSSCNPQGLGFWALGLGFGVSALGFRVLTTQIMLQICDHKGIQIPKLP